MTDTDDDMVTIRTTHNGTKPAVYHPNDCRRIPSNSREIPRADAEARGLEPCAICTGPNNGDAPGTSDRDIRSMVETIREGRGIDAEGHGEGRI